MSVYRKEGVTADLGHVNRTLWTVVIEKKENDMKEERKGGKKKTTQKAAKWMCVGVCGCLRSVCVTR